MANRATMPTNPLNCLPLSFGENFSRLLSGSPPDSNTLYLVEGSNLKGLNIKRHNYYACMKIGNLRGHPDFKNNKAKVDCLTFEKENGKAITMQMNLFWRLNHCDVGGKWYGADVCA
ncbi:hypothetical protein L4C36_17205 [Photobacterium japonica]|uniref:hypothetical protein n=1 Tax=Photobacterium japonica TaxID=2910235 RepID=UPI003D0D4E8A